MNPKIESIISCPECKGTLDLADGKISCSVCKCKFSLIEDIPVFCEIADKTDRSGEVHDEYYNQGIYYKLYNFGKRFITSDLILKNPIKELFVVNPKLGNEKVVIEIGSGNRKLGKGVINVDISTYPNVDIVADGHCMPIRDQSVDVIIIEAVLEHVKNPEVMVNELYRVLKPGGRVFSVTPFLHPYHGYPANYCNFSIDGVRELFSKFKEVETGVYRGPGSAVMNIVSDYFTLFSFSDNKYINMIIKAFFLFLMTPFKYFDKILVRNKDCHKLCACIYYIGER
jgi:SAM-dependent methyltransferase